MTIWNYVGAGLGLTYCAAHLAMFVYAVLTS